MIDLNIEKTGQPNEKLGPMKMLELTSRTFYIPISNLPDGLREAVASAYLCLRAVDEIEDHPTLEKQTKVKLLKEVSKTLQSAGINPSHEELTPDWLNVGDQLPEVTRRFPEWCLYAPPDIARRIWDSTATLADRMAFWVEKSWEIKTKKDLDAYIYAVAAGFSLTLSDLWEWYEGVKSNRELMIAFARGLQATNILKDKEKDQERGLNFFPEGWGERDMQKYARDHLKLAESYLKSLPSDSAALKFCKIPYSLAIPTLDALQDGKEKLSRSDVLAIVNACSDGNKL